MQIFGAGYFLFKQNRCLCRSKLLFSKTTKADVMQLTSYDMDCLHTARNMIMENTGHHYTIQQIAKACTLSPTKLKKGFKILFGTGLFAYFETVRFEKSKEMMVADPYKSLKQISKAIGYKHQNGFNRAFKRRYGITPGSWRKTLNTVLIFSGQIFPFIANLPELITTLIPV